MSHADKVDADGRRGVHGPGGLWVVERHHGWGVAPLACCGSRRRLVVDAAQVVHEPCGLALAHDPAAPHTAVLLWVVEPVVGVVDVSHQRPRGVGAVAVEMRALGSVPHLLKTRHRLIWREPLDQRVAVQPLGQLCVLLFGQPAHPRPLCIFCLDSTRSMTAWALADGCRVRKPLPFPRW